MTALCLYFKIHQPFLLDESELQTRINHAADNCYIPANKIILQLIAQHQDRFKISFSISGTAIELFQEYRPDVIASFRELVETGAVEILGETYYHSLASLHSHGEWKQQVKMHRKAIQHVFGVTPAVYRNTELIHNNVIAGLADDLKFKAVLCEGVESVLLGRSANQLFKSPGTNIVLLLRNARLSDDIAFRFNDDSWSERPLTAAKFAEWLNNHPAEDEVINLFMDYETFGLHKERAAGIFEFLEALPAEVLKYNKLSFNMPSEVVGTNTPVQVYDTIRTISWEDRGNASCVWSEHPVQHNMLRKLYSLEKTILSTACADTIKKWRRLQSADHFYYMTNENGKYLNPYQTEREACERYNAAVHELEIGLINRNLEKSKKMHWLRSAALGIF